MDPPTSPDPSEPPAGELDPVEPTLVDGLVREARSGSIEAQESLYQAFVAPLRGYLTSRCGPQVVRAVSIDDLCQETFLRSFEAIGVLPHDAGIEAFRGLIFRNAGWLIGKTLRKFERQQGESAIGVPVADAIHDPLGTRSQGTVTREDGEHWLFALIDRLESGHAAVLRLRMRGAQFDAIAEELEISVDAARKRYLRGSKLLRSMVDGE